MKILKNLKEEASLMDIRNAIKSEYDAVGQYEIIFDNLENEGAKKILLDILDEEKKHVGEFTKILALLSPEEIILSDQGKEEANNILREE